MTTEFPGKVLIVDVDKTFIDEVKNHPCAAQCEPICVHSVEDALTFFQQKEPTLYAIFIGSRLPGYGWIKTIQYAHQWRPGVNLYLLKDGKVSDFTDDEFYTAGFRRILGKPVDYKDLLNAAAPFTLTFNCDSAIELSKQNKDELNQETVAKDSEFCSLRSDFFLSGATAIFDLYVRLATGRYLKLLRAGDQFDLDRLSNYLRKGVSHFYIRKELQETYLNYCSHLANKILSSPEASPELKFSQTVNQGEQVVQFLESVKIGEKELKIASGFVSNVQTLFKEFKPQNEATLNSFMEELSAFNHGVASTMLAALLAENVNMGSSYSAQILGLAALLHDIGAMQLPEAIRHGIESKMSAEEVQHYRTHPLLGSNALKAISGINPAVYQAVADHHVRKNNLGYPTTTSASKISRVAEVVGLCCDFAYLIQEQNNNPTLSPVEVMQQRMEGFSRPVVEGFKLTFMTEGLTEKKKS